MATKEKCAQKTRPTPPGTVRKPEPRPHAEMMTVRDIEIGSIVTKGQLIREAQDDDHVIELASSIARHGLLEPIVVEELSPTTYQLVAGFHRLAACVRNRWSMIPANIRKKQDHVPTRSLALVENICRKEMSLSEETEAVAHLHDVEKLSPSEICQLVGKSRAWVDRRLALPNLDPEVAGACFENLISLSMAETISQVENEGVRRQILNEAIYGRRTHGQVKELIRLYEEAPGMEDAIQKGVDTAAQLKETQQPTKPCAACGASRPILELANIWVCAAGCDENSHHQKTVEGNVEQS